MEPIIKEWEVVQVVQGHYLKEEGLCWVTGCVSPLPCLTQHQGPYLHRRSSFLYPPQAPFRLLNSCLKSEDLYLVYESEKFTSTLWNISQQQLPFSLVPSSVLDRRWTTKRLFPLIFQQYITYTWLQSSVCQYREADGKGQDIEVDSV